MSALALDRQAIEKKDFPISRRGYEPEAVDQHLEALAGEVERLQRDLDAAQRSATSTGRAPAPSRPTTPVPSLAVAASEQVRVIVEAAESSAADIERFAQEEAARIRSDADTEARRTRDEAVTRSQDHVGNVSEATSTMLQRVDAMESELSSLVDSLRTGTNRLTADLSLLQGNLGDLYGAAGSTQAPAPPAERAPEPARAPEPEPEPESEPEPEPAPPAQPAVVVAAPSAADEEPEVADQEEPGLFSSTEPEPEPEPEPVAVAPAASVAVPEPAPAASGQGGGDVEGARLIALNMALNGQSREETDAYLRDNFDLQDRGGLLDEVYATVEG